MTAQPNRHEYSKLPNWASNAVLHGLKKPELQAGVLRCIEDGTALIVQMVRSKNTNRVVLVQHPVSGVAAAYARLVCPDMATTSEYVSYVVVASAPALEEADRRSVPYMITLRPGTPRGTAEVLRVPRSLFADVEAEDA